MKKRLLDLIDIERDLLNSKDPIIAIYAGTSSGKTTLIEGLHDNKNDIKGLVDYCKVDISTSRKQKVNESLKKHDDFLSHMDEYGATVTVKGLNYSVIHTNAHIETYIKEHFHKGNELTYFWRNFDFVVIDEFHSLCTDSSFAKCTFTIKTMIDAILEDKKTNNIKTKIILLSATPEPVNWLVKQWNVKVYDFREDTNYIKPKSIKLINYIPAVDDIVNRLKQGQTVVYYFAHLNNLFNLIDICIKNGILMEEIVVSISDKEKNQKLKNDYLTIHTNSEKFNDSLSENETIDNRYKLIITNGRCKEAINVNSKVDLVVVETHYYPDIIQIFGRFRHGLNKAYIIADANQFRYQDKFIEEKEYYFNKIDFDNKELEKRTFPAPEGKKFFPKHKNDKTKKYIESITKESYYEGYNYFCEEFEANELFSHYKKHSQDAIEALEVAIANEEDLSTRVHSYFKDIDIEYKKESSKIDIVDEYFSEKGWIIGKTTLCHVQYDEFGKFLKERYKQITGTNKERKTIRPILRKFGYVYERTNHRSNGKYIIRKAS